jgi:hypothetical protein
MKSHKKQKAFGPSPANNYTSGAVAPKRKFWQRKSKAQTYPTTNPNALPLHSTPADVRTSYATESTAVGHEAVGGYPKYGNQVSDGYAAPMGTATQAGHATAPYPHQPGVTPVPLAHQNVAANY